MPWGYRRGRCSCDCVALLLRRSGALSSDSPPCCRQIRCSRRSAVCCGCGDTMLIRDIRRRDSSSADADRSFARRTTDICRAPSRADKGRLRHSRGTRHAVCHARKCLCRRTFGSCCEQPRGCKSSSLHSLCIVRECDCVCRSANLCRFCTALCCWCGSNCLYRRSLCSDTGCGCAGTSCAPVAWLPVPLTTSSSAAHAVYFL